MKEKDQEASIGKITEWLPPKLTLKPFAFIAGFQSTLLLEILDGLFWLVVVAAIAVEFISNTVKTNKFKYLWIILVFMTSPTCFSRKYYYINGINFFTYNT